MAILSDETRQDAAAKLRAAADLMEQGDVKAAGMTLLNGLGSVARDLRAAYGPLAKIIVKKHIDSLFG